MKSENLIPALACLSLAAFSLYQLTRPDKSTGRILFEVALLLASLYAAYLLLSR